MTRRSYPDLQAAPHTAENRLAHGVLSSSASESPDRVEVRRPIVIVLGVTSLDGCTIIGLAAGASTPAYTPVVAPVDEHLKPGDHVIVTTSASEQIEGVVESADARGVAVTHDVKESAFRVRAERRELAYPEIRQIELRKGTRAVRGLLVRALVDVMVIAVGYIAIAVLVSGTAGPATVQVDRSSRASDRGDVWSLERPMNGRPHVGGA